MTKIIMTTGKITKVFDEFDNLDEAIRCGEDHDWAWVDENGFVWELNIDEN